MDKDDIIMKLSRYYVISRQLEEIQQMCKGLNSFGLLDSLKDFADSAIAEFVYDPKTLKSSLIKNMYQVEYSKTGTEERDREEDLIYQWYQFLDELNAGMEKEVMLHDIDAPHGQVRKIGLQAVLRFLTGSSYPPVTFKKEKVGQVIFLHGCSAGRRISASTCLVRIMFPVNERYMGESFSSSFAEDIIEGPGFGLV
eukprot:gene14582-16085_t